MGKFYRGASRTISSSEYGRFHRDILDHHSSLRVTLGRASANKSWIPARVYINGEYLECGGWSGAFLEVSRLLIKNKEDAIRAFVDAVGVRWIYQGRCGMKAPMIVGNGWYVDVGAPDGVLIARLKYLVTVSGINPDDVMIFNAADDSPPVKARARDAVFVGDDSPAPTLDTDQMRFVKSDARNARLLAPAGSGKTLTMLYRCVELVSRNPSSKILLVTYTRAARDELKLRIGTRKEFENLSDRVVVTTINQYGYRLLKKKFASCRLISEKRDKLFVLGNHLRVVAKKSRTISENIDSKKWALRNSPKILEVIDAFKSLGMDHRLITNARKFDDWSQEITRGELRDIYYAQIGKLVNLKIFPEMAPNEIPSKRIYDLFIRFHCASCEILKDMNLFTIEDQKYWGWLSLKDSAKVSGAARYSHIMVDEFQDVNPIDMLFISALVNQHNAELTIVGDDDQTIFEWRGATPAYIVNPDRWFGGKGDQDRFSTFILTRNYRSPKNIVDMSQRLISRNKIRVQKEVVAVRKDDAEVKVLELSDYDAIAKLVIDDIENAEIRNVVLVSRKKSQLIPYQIIFASKEVDFYAAEDLNVFLTDAFRALRSLILMKVRQRSFTIPTTDLVEDLVTLVNHLGRYRLSRSDTDMLRSQLLGSYCQTYDGLIEYLMTMPGIGRFTDFRNAAQVLKSFFNASTIEESLDCISENFDGFRQDFQKADDDIFYADPPFAELASFSARYGSDFEKFYSDIELTVSTLATVVHVENDSDDVSQNAKEAFTSKVHLMTALRTKGKEFDSVYLLHADKGVWPINKANTAERLEAERRLFYVAVTRARKRLVFIRSRSAPSPYLSEMGLLNDRDGSAGVRRKNLDLFKRLGIDEIIKEAGLLG